jgi:hypothetical protein
MRGRKSVSFILHSSNCPSQRGAGQSVVPQSIPTHSDRRQGACHTTLPARLLADSNRFDRRASQFDLVRPESTRFERIWPIRGRLNANCSGWTAPAPVQASRRWSRQIRRNPAAVSHGPTPAVTPCDIMCNGFVTGQKFILPNVRAGCNGVTGVHPSGVDNSRPNLALTFNRRPRAVPRRRTRSRWIKPNQGKSRPIKKLFNNYWRRYRPLARKFICFPDWIPDIHVLHNDSSGW